MSGTKIRFPLNIRIPESGIRADLAVLRSLRPFIPSLSRRIIKQWLISGRVLLDDFGIFSGSHLLKPGSHELRIQDWSEADEMSPIASAAPEAAPLGILFENDVLLIVDKPCGMPSVPHSPEETHTAVNHALAHVPSLDQIGKQGLEPGILNRLDTATSGILVFAKTEPEFKRLKAAWKSIEKTYIAISVPDPSHFSPEDMPVPFHITHPLYPDPHAKKRVLIWRRSGKKPPESLLRAHSTLLALKKTSNHRWAVTILIQSGARHQIRVHLSDLGLPILGDELYGGPSADRLYLHAWKIRLPDASGRMLTIEAPIPWV